MPAEQGQTAGDVHQQIAQSGANDSGRPRNQIRNTDGEGHHFPEQEQGDKIAGVNRANRTGDINPGGDVLRSLL